MVGLALYLWSGAAIAAAPVLPEHSTAQRAEVTPDTLLECMLAETSPETEDLFRRFIIAILSDAHSEARGLTVQVGTAVLNLAFQKCEMPYSWAEGDEFEKLAGRYGEMLGTRVIEKALDKLN